MVAYEMEKLFQKCDVLLTPPMRGEILSITNFTGHPALALRTGFVEVTVARNDWAPDPKNPVPTFQTPRRVPHGVSLIGRLFDEGRIGTVGIALERASGVAGERPPGF
jgi:Asp-tRNA(Asn)/Glu-tRNA(Gln) amidotransferase A subunit family amidase